MSFPNKEQRLVCYNARDAYWACLDKHDNNVDVCAALRESFVKACASTWVKHFDRKREYEKFKDKILNEGYDPANEKHS